MFPAANVVSHLHIMVEFGGEILVVIQPRVVHKESVGQVIDLVKA